MTAPPPQPQPLPLPLPQPTQPTQPTLPQPRLDLETPRLLLRPWTTADTEWHRRLVTERGGATPTPEEDAQVIARLLEAARVHGVVPSVVVVKHTAAVAGYCGLVVGRSSVAEPELAYELFAREHGNGYATEAARAVLTAAAAAGRTRLWSTTRPWNVASLRVMAKLGFRRDHSTWDERGEILWNVLDLTPEH